MAERLSAEARASALRGLPGWAEVAGRGGDRPYVHVSRISTRPSVSCPAWRWWPKRTTITRNGGMFTRPWRWCWQRTMLGGVTARDIDLGQGHERDSGGSSGPADQVLWAVGFEPVVLSLILQPNRGVTNSLTSVRRRDICRRRGDIAGTGNH